MTIDKMNLPLMLYFNEISISLQQYKNKGFMIFLNVTLRPFMKYRESSCFPSRSITKNPETHPPPMRDVIIEQPLVACLRYSGCN